MSNSNVVIRKKTLKTGNWQDPVLSFRLEIGFKQTIDHWRSMEPDKPSRSEAIRLLSAKDLR